MAKGKDGVRGTASLYKEEYADLAYEILSSGRSMADVCARINISKATYWNWQQAHADFKMAIQLGMVVGESYWMEKYREHMLEPDFNKTALWSYISATYNNGRTKAIDIDLTGVNYKESHQKLISSLRGNNLTSREASELSGVLVNGALINEKEDLVRKVAELEQLVGK